MRIIRIRIKVCRHNFIVLFSHFIHNFLNIFKLLWYIPYSRKYQSFLPLCISFCSFFSEHKFAVLSCVSAHNIAPQFYLLTFLFRGGRLFAGGPFINLCNNAFRRSFFILLHCLLIIRFTELVLRSGHACIYNRYNDSHFYKLCNHWKTNLSLETS